MGVYLDIYPDLLDIIVNDISLMEIDNIPLMQVSGSRFDNWAQVVKRLFDVFSVVILGIILSPLVLFVAIIIKIESSGPLIFTQSRIGKGERHFRMYKFRTMQKDSEHEKQNLVEKNEADGFLFKMKNDPRITKMGKIMRRYSIDEIPQLINVLKGDMSLIGPRPLPADDLDKISDKSGYYYWFQNRTKIHPGLTGLWQVNGRSEINFSDLVNLDIYYLENWSLWLDFQILLKTIPAVLSGKGAY
jgi:exopolysaccharide biosynthesis polyprenyl glycosylphosphotransferase